jgi:peptidoglycan/xylan/chitin deacetylase (PgdA/CDA1 family)
VTARLGRLARRARRRLAPDALVLVYHSVAETGSDPWALHVSPARFAEQMETLRGSSLPLPLRELVDASRRRTLRRGAVAVTFDDGYAGTLRGALPALERFDVPATTFVTTSAVGSTEEFWSDALERLLLHPGRFLRVPALGDQEAEQTLAAALEYTEADLARHAGWRALVEPPPTPRHEAYLSLWERMRPLPHRGREKILREIRDALEDPPEPRPTHRALTLAELRELGSSPLVEIGAHTVTHPALAALPPAEQREEVEGSRRALEAWLERPVTAFAYPYGRPCDLDDHSVEAVRRAGFAVACVNRPGVVDGGSDPLRVPRFHVGDWDGDRFARTLRWWWGAPGSRG